MSNGFDPFGNSGVDPSGFGVGTESVLDDGGPVGQTQYSKDQIKLAQQFGNQINSFLPTIQRAVDFANKANNPQDKGLHLIYYNAIFDPLYDPRRQFRRCAVSEECGAGYICNGERCQFVGSEENPDGDGCSKRRDKFFDIPDKPPRPSCRKSNPQKRPKARSCGAPAPGVVPAGKSCVPIVWPVPEKPWCGTRCCSCGTSGCNCYEGECPPPGQRCTRFCDEAGKSGSNVLRCGFKKCPVCQYCKMVDNPDPIKLGEVPRCVARTVAGADCRCGYLCPGCMECNFAGNCEIRVCPKPPKTDPPPVTTCEPECIDTEVCVTNPVLGTVTCNTVQQCGDIPEECEPCDCNCNDECPECQICNAAGKCEPDPECEKCIPDRKLLVTTTGFFSYTPYNSACQLQPRVSGGGEKSEMLLTTECGPLKLLFLSEPKPLWNISQDPACPTIERQELTAEPGEYKVVDGRGNSVATGTYTFPTPGGRITATSIFPDMVNLADAPPEPPGDGGEG